MAALGDSITAGSPGYDPDPAARQALGFGDDPRSQYEYWAERSTPRLRFRNCGVFGETTAQIAVRLPRCTRGADALVVQGGIIDIARTLRGPAPILRFAVNEAAANVGRMIDAGQRLGLRVAVANVLPWNRGFPAAAPSIRRLNRLIGVTAELKGVPVLSFNRALADPRNPGLMRRPLTADGSHPSVAGYRRLGSLVVDRFG